MLAPFNHQSGIVPFSPEVGALLAKYAGPISQYSPSFSNSNPYIGMLTTGNSGQLIQLEAPQEELIVMTDFAEVAAPLFELVEVHKLMPGETTIKHHVIQVGTSPFVETAPLVPGPKGHLKTIDVNTTPSRYAHGMEIEYIALQTPRGKKMWELLRQQQSQGAAGTLAMIILSGIIANVPPSLPYGPSDPRDTHSWNSGNLEESVNFIRDTFGAITKGRTAGLAYLMGVVKEIAQRRGIRGGFKTMVTDEGLDIALMRHANRQLETVIESKSIAEISLLIEKLLGLKIVQVGPLPLPSNLGPAVPPFRNTVKILHHMIAEVNEVIRFYDRKLDIFTNLKVPDHDSLGNPITGSVLILRPAIYETSSGVLISDANKPRLFVSDLTTKLGLNIQQLSVTEHTVFFSGMAVVRPEGLLGLPNIRIIKRIKGDGKEATKKSFDKVGDINLFSDRDDDLYFFGLEGDIAPEKYPFIHVSGTFPGGSNSTASMSTFEYADVKQIKGSGDMIAKQLGDRAASLTEFSDLRRSYNKKGPAISYLDEYWIINGRHVVGNSLFGRHYEGMMSDVYGRAMAPNDRDLYRPIN